MKSPATPRPRVRRARKAAPDTLPVVLRSLEESKAEGLLPIDITGRAAFADHMVVASGRSQRHVNAIAQRLLDDLKAAGHGNARVEGLRAGDWVLVDLGDVIVHIFQPEVRSFYNIEKRWLASEDDAGIPAIA